MDTSPHIEIAEEPAISCNTAASCLALVSAKIGTYCAIGDIRARMGRENAVLPVSYVIRVARQFGFTAQHLHGDWQWLELAVETRTVLLLLKNGNVIVAIGPGRLGAHELVVSDPLHDDGAMIVLPRETFSARGTAMRLRSPCNRESVTLLLLRADYGLPINLG